MIVETSTFVFVCRKCQSSNVRRNGFNASKSPLYHCYDCKFYGTMNPRVKYTEARKEEIIGAYQERASMRGIQRVFGTAPATLSKWIKKKPA